MGEYRFIRATAKGKCSRTTRQVPSKAGAGGSVSAVTKLENRCVIYASWGSLLLTCGGNILNSGTLGNRPGSVLNPVPSVLNVLSFLPAVGDVDNTGTIDVNRAGAVTIKGNLNNKPNGAIRLLGGTLSANTIRQSEGATFEGFGGVTGDVVIKREGIIKLTGPTSIVGDVSIERDAELEISDGQVLITGHATCDGTIHMKGGQIIPQGGLSGDCNIISEPSIYSGMADFTLDGKTNFRQLVVLADTWLYQTNWN